MGIVVTYKGFAQAEVQYLQLGVGSQVQFVAGTMVQILRQRVERAGRTERAFTEWTPVVLLAPLRATSQQQALVEAVDGTGFGAADAGVVEAAPFVGTARYGVVAESMNRVDSIVRFKVDADLVEALHPETGAIYSIRQGEEIRAGKDEHAQSVFQLVSAAPGSTVPQELPPPPPGTECPVPGSVYDPTTGMCITPGGETSLEHVPFYRRVWFWGLVTAGVVGATAATVVIVKRRRAKGVSGHPLQPWIWGR